ncbi:hypothetical protein Ctob_012928 [Chrysochromulina tobinii]|uniref:Uncharacterized protein n=1 Tax=Chrysochromulina tobinii TaxID=1460289 RepID=A0A0M0JQL7_9EUKA|nr:hypothetical protein Ctob_012928 [Chrysochromulina tobinii]|eukprot:KOO28587.1 hypothetical protein Ctob_012928 [Chrysochromulina sp. CCMP291]
MDVVAEQLSAASSALSEALSFAVPSVQSLSSAIDAAEGALSACDAAADALMRSEKPHGALVDAVATIALAVEASASVADALSLNESALAALHDDLRAMLYRVLLAAIRGLWAPTRDGRIQAPSTTSPRADVPSRAVETALRIALRVIDAEHDEGSRDSHEPTASLDVRDAAAAMSLRVLAAAARERSDPAALLLDAWKAVLAHELRMAQLAISALQGTDPMPSSQYASAISRHEAAIRHHERLLRAASAGEVNELQVVAEELASSIAILERREAVAGLRLNEEAELAKAKRGLVEVREEAARVMHEEVQDSVRMSTWAMSSLTKLTELAATTTSVREAIVLAGGLEATCELLEYAAVLDAVAGAMGFDGAPHGALPKKGYTSAPVTSAAAGANSQQAPRGGGFGGKGMPLTKGGAGALEAMTIDATPTAFSAASTTSAFSAMAAVTIAELPPSAAMAAATAAARRGQLAPLPPALLAHASSLLVALTFADGAEAAGAPCRAPTVGCRYGGWR